MNRRQNVTVIGSGVAGAAIAHGCVREGFDVRLLYRAAEEGASFTNQKWHHSGLLYPSEKVLKQAWSAHQSDDPLLVQHAFSTHEPARFLCLREETLDQRRRWLDEWRVKEMGLEWEELSAAELAPFPSVAGGFHGPDRAIDFPALIRQLRKEVETAGANVIEGAHVTNLLFGWNRRVYGVTYRLDDREQELQSDHTVLAAGAWSINLLELSGITLLPKLVRKKCIVLSYPGELVRGITVCLDVAKHDGSLGDTTLVPFH